jgi:hypothetical protein
MRVLRNVTGRMSLPGLHPWRVGTSQTLIPVPIPKRRSKSAVVAGLLLTLMILAGLYYMIFVVAVPCGANVNAHLTIWQIMTGGSCR